MEKTFAGNIINEFYDDEGNEDYFEALNMKITVSGKVSDVTMLDAIAARFGTTRSSLVSDLIHNSVLEMYFVLSKEDKEKLSLTSDLETSRFLTKKGITQSYVGMGLDGKESTDEDMTWRRFNAIILDSEKDKKNVNS
jgi:predicted Zn-dependent peptidase